MKNYRTTLVLLLAVVLLALAAGCSDDDNGTDSGGTFGIYGQWAAVAGTDAAYVNFGTDNVFDVLYLSEFAFHTKSTGVFFATSNQVILTYNDRFDAPSTGRSITPQTSGTEDADQGPSNGVWNYSVHGDTLIIAIPGDTMKFERDAAAPTAAEWLPALLPNRMFEAPIPATCDIAFHGGHLWYGNARESDYIYEIDPITGEAVDSIGTQFSAYAIGWSYDSLWIADNGYARIRMIDTVTGASLHSSPEMGSWIYGIAWTGTEIWTVANNGRKYYRYDDQADVVTDSIYHNLQPGGLAYVNGYLWSVADGMLHRCQLPSLQAIASYQLPGYELRGVTWDGEYLWVSTNEYPQPTIFRVTLP